MISAPALVLRGGADAIVSEDEQRAFLLGATNPTMRLLQWPDGEHTLYNRSAERYALTADWFSRHLGA